MAPDALTFRASLDGFPGVSRDVAVRSDRTLVDLHRILQRAFGWADDHLYSFWLDGDFWGSAGPEYTAPLEVEPGPGVVSPYRARRRNAFYPREEAYVRCASAHTSVPE